MIIMEIIFEQEFFIVVEIYIFFIVVLFVFKFTCLYKL